MLGNGKEIDFNNVFIGRNQCQEGVQVWMDGQRNKKQNKQN